MTSLQLTNVDMQRSRNAAAHRTAKYDTSQLVVRRGLNFVLNLICNRPIQSGDSMTITVETGSSPSTSGNTRAVMPVSSSGGVAAWSAVSGRSSTNSIPITINIPPTSVIGLYKMNMQITSQGRTSSSDMGTFAVLFNPWASADEVYMANEAERQEYVLNETGVFWAGSVSRFSTIAWDYSQFEKDMIDICLLLLERSSIFASDKAADVSRRSDPLHVGRVMTAMVNSNDLDNGVIQGNWSGDYSGGENPSYWNGSASILRKWRNGGPVKYGQCWVFAGVLCTVLRCLGIPARLIINFESAHDTDGNLCIDTYYDSRGNKDNTLTSDSIWNFHAWNEMWSKRKDIGTFYDGWQILDATPQERSKGIFRLGPCSLTAVKEGDVHLAYDTTFVYSEVNADQKQWIKTEDGYTRLYRTLTAGVGQLTSTKAIGDTFTRLDITNDYKYPENSAKEREVFKKAQSKVRLVAGVAAFSRPAVAVREVEIKPEFNVTIKVVETQIGETLPVELNFKSTADQTMTLASKCTFTSIIYNNNPVKEILTETQSVTLEANEAKTVSLKLTFDQYKEAITADNMINISVLCEDEIGGKMIVEKVAKLKSPTLEFRINEPVKMNKKTDVKAIFINPLHEDVTDCVLTVEGSGLMNEPVVMKIPLIKKEQCHTFTIAITPYRVGSRCIIADLHAKEITNVKAYKSVVVAPN